MSYDETFYLVTDDFTARIDTPGVELYDEDFEPVDANEIRNSGGRRIRIVMLTPEGFEQARETAEMGLEVGWKDPE